MKKKFLNLMLVFFLIFMTFITFMNNSESSGNFIYVKADYIGFNDGSAEKPYNNIQDAINLAEDGDTIYVFGGLYEESLIIDKKIKIEGGVDKIETIIDPIYHVRYLVEINSDEVTIESITFQDDNSDMSSTIGAFIYIESTNNRIIGNKLKNTISNGIYIGSTSSDNLIDGNSINNTNIGIKIYNSNTNDITNNVISKSNENGIEIESSSINNLLYGNNVKNSVESGIKIKESNDIIARNNTIKNCGYYGIHILNSENLFILNNSIENNIGGGLYQSSSQDTIHDNIFKENTRGITLIGDNNLIYNNSFVSSSASAIYAQASSLDNVIFLNKFLDNSISAKDEGQNIWYQDQRGNYWSDYNYADITPEEHPDGIGDRPYSKNGVLDEYPLGYFLKPPKKPSKPKPEDKETGVSVNIRLSVYIQDPDSDRLNVYFYGGIREKDNTLNITLIESQTRNPIKNVPSGSTVSCSFTLGFNTTYAWYVIVDDGLLQNVSDTYFFYTTRTPPDNEPPVADGKGPYYGKINEKIIFDASDSYDPDGNIEFYRWNFGDGTSEILSISPSHTYYNSGTYNVILTVIDNNGTSTTDVVQVFISSTAKGNKTPIADPGGPYYGEVGEEIVFDGSESRDQDYGGSITNYIWDFGDGTTSSKQNPNHKYSYAGNFTIKLTVTDETGLKDTSIIFALIKSKSSDESPGFELILTIILILCFTIIIKRRKFKN